jgi:uncharacterized membrane protein YphA (DoxX/SURF4 family)
MIATSEGTDFNFKALRFIFYITLFFLIDPEKFFSFSNLPSELWMPTGVFAYLSEPIFLSESAIRFLSILWKTVVVLCALGVQFKILSKVFFALTFFMINTIHNYGFIPHAFMPIVLACYAMAFGGTRKVFLVRLIFCSVFFNAGISKILNGGIDWVASTSIQNIFLRSEIYFHDVAKVARAVRLEEVLSKHLVVAQWLAGFSIVLEVVSPLALFKNRLKYLIIPGLMVMQITIYFLIFVNFNLYICLYIFWIDWQKVASAIIFYGRRTISWSKYFITNLGQ